MKIFNCFRQSSSECKKLSKRNCFPQLKSAWHRLPTMYQSDSFDLEFLGANNVYIRYINFPNIYHKHCAKGVQIQSFFWSAFSRIDLVNPCIQSPNTGKYGSEKVRYLDSFHAVEKQRSIQHPVKHLFYENSKSLRTVNYFHKMVHPRCLTEF